MLTAGLTHPSWHPLPYPLGPGSPTLEQTNQVPPIPGQLTWVLSKPRGLPVTESGLCKELELRLTWGPRAASTALSGFWKPHSW